VFSTGLAMLAQDRALRADLERAAQVRLERAASAADRLLEGHLGAALKRYRAISRTPEFRANLEVNHAPTLNYFADRLADEQRSSLLLFLGPEDEPIAVAGQESLIASTLEALNAARSAECTGTPAAAAASGDTPPSPDTAKEAVSERPAPLPADCSKWQRGGLAKTVTDGERLFVLAAISLVSQNRSAGHVVAVEPIPEGTLRDWSELCGASFSLAANGENARAVLSRVIRTMGETELRVTASLEAERKALANARRRLVTAGSLALALAFAASLLLARSLESPIREIQVATEQIGAGDFELRLDSTRRDEIGDVARAFNLMLERLRSTVGSLRQSQERLANAQRLARLGNWRIEPNARTVEASTEFRRLYDLADADDPVPLDQLLERIHPDDRHSLQNSVEICLHEGRPLRQDHRINAPDGSERILHIQGEAVLDEGSVVAIDGTAQDITESRHVEEQIRFLAYHDSLTGLGNRRLFNERLALSLEEARRGEHRVGVLFLDLDRFKVINDTLGHSVGDRLLKEVADRLVTSVHTTDLAERSSTKLQDSTISRLGDDEFTILLSEMDDAKDAARVARRVLDSLSRPFELDGQKILVSGSIGITTAPDDGDDAEALLRNCDTAMYHAKQSGRNRYQFCDATLNAVVFKRLLLENKLRGAIDRNELELFYQPRVSMSTGRVTGVEALARWRDADLGVISPVDFIPIAEEVGLISAISSWVLRAALHQTQIWRESSMAEVRVAVNLSGRHLELGTFSREVVDLLEETGVSPSMLELEITESALLQDEEAVIAGLQELRDRGVRIALDDFGTGYSSLSYLRCLPLDTLKIDRDFIRTVDTEPVAATLVGAIVSMAKVLQLEVVVEGVETEEQYTALLEIGCDEIQGNFHSPPVRAEQIPQVIQELESRKPKKRRQSDTRRQRRPRRGR
jgi:diguanylate cyclase (GGDEF)-like protein/PAS domain S-box-containing protein